MKLLFFKLGDQTMDFTIESFFNPHLTLGSTRIDSIISVTSSNLNTVKSSANAKKAIVFVLDISGSMYDRGKIDMGKLAIRKCIDLLDEKCLFSVIAFQNFPKIVVPMTPVNRNTVGLAHEKIKRLNVGGGTRMSSALEMVLDQFKGLDDAITYVQFVTDGQNNPNDKKALLNVLSACEGKFQCDCWGIGTDWHPEEIRMISNCLLGSADAVPDPNQLEIHFKNALTLTMSKGIGDVRLRLQVPKTSKLLTVKQMSPEIIDLTKLAKNVNEKIVDVPLGAWGTECRDYHVAFEIEAQSEGEEMMACRPKIIYIENDSEILIDGQRIIATWTDDESLTAKINPQVAHYTGQEELANSIREGLEAKSRGDIEQATVLLGKAAKIAFNSGNEEVTRRLKKVVEIVDVEQGTVRLHSKNKLDDRAAELELDMGGTRTVRKRSSTSNNKEDS